LVPYAISYPISWPIGAAVAVRELAIFKPMALEIFTHGDTQLLPETLVRRFGHLFGNQLLNLFHKGWVGLSCRVGPGGPWG
jgi:hypothetical protein